MYTEGTAREISSMTPVEPTQISQQKAHELKNNDVDNSMKVVDGVFIMASDLGYKNIMGSRSGNCAGRKCVKAQCSHKTIIYRRILYHCFHTLLA